MPTFHITVHPENQEQVKALRAFLKALKLDFKIQKEEEEEYDPDFVKKLLKSREDYKQGKGVVMSQEEIDNLWK